MKNLTVGTNDTTAINNIKQYTIVEKALMLSFNNLFPMTTPRKVQNYTLRIVIVRKFCLFVYFLSSLGSELVSIIFTYCIAKM